MWGMAPAAASCVFEGGVDGQEEGTAGGSNAAGKGGVSATGSGCGSCGAHRRVERAPQPTQPPTLTHLAVKCPRVVAESQDAVRPLPKDFPRLPALAAERHRHARGIVGETEDISHERALAAARLCVGDAVHALAAACSCSCSCSCTATCTAAGCTAAAAACSGCCPLGAGCRVVALHRLLHGPRDVSLAGGAAAAAAGVVLQRWLPAARHDARLARACRVAAVDPLRRGRLAVWFVCLGGWHDRGRHEGSGTRVDAGAQPLRQQRC